MKRNILYILVFSFIPFLSKADTSSDYPLVKTSWHQSAPFNAMCPLVNNAAPAAGCGAIAVGQIMKFYQKPLHGFGRVQYTSKGNNIDVDFDQLSFDYGKIRDTYPSNLSDTQAKNAVASLVFQVGAAMHMQYGTASSPTNFPCMMWGLQHYLHFSPLSRFRYRRYYSTAEWTEMLNRELKQGHPVFYRGAHTAPGTSAGHFFILDGINVTGQYHANFGHASSTQDKYLDLNAINQGTASYPGNCYVCYHHQQAMITDFYPCDSLTSSDFDSCALIINSPIILKSNPRAKQITAQNGNQIQANFTIYNVNEVSSKQQLSLGFYQDDKLCATSPTIRTASLGAGFHTTIDRTFTLPSMRRGQYTMSVICRPDANSAWIKAWDCAPNSIPVSVNSIGYYTFSMPDYHNLECNLKLESAIAEATDGKTGGKTFEFTLRNPSTNNFEDSIRLEFSTATSTKRYEMPTSIYDGQKVTYRLFVKSSDINLGNNYTVKAFYRENLTHSWIELESPANGITQPFAQKSGDIKIYSITGILLHQIHASAEGDNYNAFLQNLYPGIYIISDSNGTRKFVKTT